MVWSAYPTDLVCQQFRKQYTHCRYWSSYFCCLIWSCACILQTCKHHHYIRPTRTIKRIYSKTKRFKQWIRQVLYSQSDELNAKKLSHCRFMRSTSQMSLIDRPSWLIDSHEEQSRDEVATVVATDKSKIPQQKSQPHLQDRSRNPFVFWDVEISVWLIRLLFKEMLC